MPALLWIIIGIFLMDKLSLAIRRPRKRDCSEYDDHQLCGSNGVTYLNFCEYQMARMEEPYIEIENRGPCHCSREEKYEWDPICGTDTDSYANYCEFQKAKTFNHGLRLRHRDLCQEFLKRDYLTYREVQKIAKWKSFMPKELYREFKRRPVQGAPMQALYFKYLYIKSDLDADPPLCKFDRHTTGDTVLGV